MAQRNDLGYTQQTGRQVKASIEWMIKVVDKEDST